MGTQAPLVGCHMVSLVVKIMRLEEIEPEGAKGGVRNPKSN